MFYLGLKSEEIGKLTKEEYITTLTLLKEQLKLDYKTESERQVNAIKKAFKPQFKGNKKW